MYVKSRNQELHGYSSNRRYVSGSGFVDSLSTIFNSLRSSAIPALREVGSYISENRDLLAKPILGAVGSLAATGVSAGVPALFNHIMNRNRGVRKDNPKDINKDIAPLDAKSMEILKSIMTRNESMDSEYNPVSNIIGSGKKGRKKIGSGIKSF
jgi:hypothetical protein